MNFNKQKNAKYALGLWENHRPATSHW